MSEYDIIQDCYKKLTDLNKYDHLCLEVPFLSRSIDMVAVTENEEIITIEFKLHDWKRALRQACDHARGADRSYICVPEKTVPDTMISALQESGIGLLFYKENSDDCFREVIAAKPNKDSWIEWKLSLKRTLEQLIEESYSQIIPSSKALVSPL